tara:strand:- start:85 stop:249 length:165 start_codon:yes stop_codon:yes gene_type:complete
MGTCLSTHYNTENIMDRDTRRVTDDRPYEERTREERMDSEARQMIASMNNNRWD